MVKIELMMIEPGTHFTGRSEQTLFKRLSSKTLFPPLPPPGPPQDPALGCNSIVTSSFTGLRSHYQTFKLLGGRPVYSGGGRAGRCLQTKKEEEDLPMTRLSLPCVQGCCYCVYGRLLGPVRVYMSKYTPEKDERKIRGITDGNGNRVFPVSRKRDIKGLVYDQDSFSLHPPPVSERRVKKKARMPRYRHGTASNSVRSVYRHGPPSTSVSPVYRHATASNSFSQSQRNETGSVRPDYRHGTARVYKKHIATGPRIQDTDIKRMLSSEVNRKGAR